MIKQALIVCFAVQMSLGAQLQVARNTEDRIVGGQEAVPNSLPYMALLLYFGIPSCGAVILDEWNILTAAHCVDDTSVNIVDVGEHNIEIEEGTEQFLRVKERIYHEAFDPISLVNDVAIIHLAQPVVMNQFAQPIQLAAQDTSFPDGLIATISGWGQLGLTEGAPKALHVNQVALMNDQECAQIFEDELGIALDMETMLCGGPPGDGVCFGDSGSPLVKDNTLVGITSWVAPGDCSVQYPHGYARATRFTQWFLDNMSSGEY